MIDNEHTAVLVFAVLGILILLVLLTTGMLAHYSINSRKTDLCGLNGVLLGVAKIEGLMVERDTCGDR